MRSLILGPRAAAALAVAILSTAACTAAATPAATFGPAPTAAATAAPTAEPSAEPTAAPTILPTLAPTPFIAGTAEAPREISVAMTDAFRFEPDTLAVQAGETVTFVLTNAGVIPHDFTIGDEEAQEHHAMEMMQGGMHMGTDANAIAVDAGKTAELTFTFGPDPAEWLIGCHVPGHYEAGMKGTLSIVASMP